jgi:uncharacterized membrane protein
VTVSAGPALIAALEWKITGLPLHPLVVHAAVVFTPLASLSALAYVALGRYREQLRWPTLVLAVVAFGSIWAAYLTGNNFFASPHFDNFSGELLDRIEKHQSYARTLRWIATGFAIVTVAATYLHDRQGTRKNVLGGLVVVLAVLTLVWVALTGDAGARAVWSD